MSNAIPVSQIHAGEGQPSTGCNAALQQTKTTPEELQTGGVVDVTAGLAQAARAGTAGLNGIWATLANVSAVAVICYMVLVQQPSQFAAQTERFDRIIDKIQAGHDRSYERLAGAIDRLTARLGGRGSVGELPE